MNPQELNPEERKPQDVTHDVTHDVGFEFDELLVLHAHGELAPVDPDQARMVERQLANDPDAERQFKLMKADVLRIQCIETDTGVISATHGTPEEFDRQLMELQRSRRRMKLAVGQSVERQRIQDTRVRVEVQPTRMSPWIVYPLTVAATLAFALSAWMYLDGPGRTGGIPGNDQIAINDAEDRLPPERTTNSNMSEDEQIALVMAGSVNSLSMDSMSQWAALDNAAYSAQVLSEDFGN